ncbi:MAG: translation initiation factor IF-1 [Bdellovibrionota bacterium]
MSRDDLVSLEGSVVATTGGGNYQIKLENGTIILARLSGKIKRFKIKILVGDKVTVAVSPYDPTHGFITHRQRLNT